jgi:hypothetical protein
MSVAGSNQSASSISHWGPPAKALTPPSATLLAWPPPYPASASWFLVRASRHGRTSSTRLLYPQAAPPRRSPSPEMAPSPLECAMRRMSTETERRLLLLSSCRSPTTIASRLLLIHLETRHGIELHRTKHCAPSTPAAHR